MPVWMISSIFALLIALSVIAGVRSANEVICHQTILCPCGNTGKYVKVCAKGENPCIRWSSCKTCKDGLDGCLECPEGTDGSSCTKVPEILSRQRRQYPTPSSKRGNRRTRNTPTHNQRQGEVPEKLSRQRRRRPFSFAQTLPVDGAKSSSNRSLSRFRRQLRACRTTEYRCLDGQCIPDEWKCDADPDCDDGLDEGPACEPEIRICSTLGKIPNGYRTKTFRSDVIGGRSRKRLASLRYFCEDGYSLEGNETIDCRASGNQPYQPPQCVREPGENYIFCKNPGPFLDGSVEYIPRSSTVRAKPPASKDQMYPPGSVFEYSCNSGYVLGGESEIKCEETGHWSSRPPTCVKPNSLIIESACVSPGPIINGKIRYVYMPGGLRYRPTNNSGFSAAYSRGTRLVFACDTGYMLDSTNEITCLEEGRWSDHAPVCLNSDSTNRIECRNPGPLINGKFNYSSRFGDIGEKPTTWLPAGLKITYKCNEDYKLDGPNTLTCLSTGYWTALKPECILSCGKTAAGANPKILHGNKVDAGEWPWVVAIARQENGYPVVICGGAVLNHETVLTAAHCLNRNERYTLYFGKLYRNNDLDDNLVQVARSQRVIIHPSYTRATYDSDIAIIKVAPIKFSLRVQPVCLPTARTTSSNLDVGRRGYVTGWGENEKQVSSEELMMAHLPFQSNDHCEDSFRSQSENNVAPNITQNMFCAGFPQAEQSTCRGDSGSPFVFYDYFTQESTIEGIVSFTVEGQCGLPGIYSVYTKVHKFLPWILKYMEEGK